MEKWIGRIFKTGGSNVKYFQQGDVLLFEEKIPKISKKEAEITKNPVLQHGEATGHAHRLHPSIEQFHDSSGVPNIGFEVVLNKATGTRHLKVTTPQTLRHEEHKEIQLPPGEYRIGIVREYDHFKEEAREVVD